MSFIPYQCSQCPTWEPAPYLFGSSTLGFGVEPDNDTPVLAANNQRNRRLVFGNAFAFDIRFNAAWWGTNYPNDKIKLQQYPNATTHCCNPTNSPRWLNVATSLSLQWMPVTLEYFTDGSNPSTGFSMTSAEVCCSATTDALVPANPVIEGMRHTGILMATNDVVSFWIPGVQGPSGRLHVSVQPHQSSGFNPDVFVRCGALPSNTSWLKAGATASGFEFLRILHAECASPNNLYIRVRSASGAGSFDLMVARQETPHPYIMDVAIETFDPVEIAAVQQTIRNAVRSLYGATLGQYLIRTVNIHLHPPGTIDDDFGDCRDACGNNISNLCTCFINEQLDNGHAEAPGDAIMGRATGGGPGPWLNYDLLTHEWGHAVLSQDDEYEQGSECFRCGHTIMAAQWLENNHLCIDGPNANHRKDAATGCSLEPWPAGWDRTTLLDQPHDYTPDSYDFIDHPLGGYPYFGPF